MPSPKESTQATPEARPLAFEERPMPSSDSKSPTPDRVDIVGAAELRRLGRLVDLAESQKPVVVSAIFKPVDGAAAALCELWGSHPLARLAPTLAAPTALGEMRVQGARVGRLTLLFIQSPGSSLWKAWGALDGGEGLGGLLHRRSLPMDAILAVTPQALDAAFARFEQAAFDEGILPGLRADAPRRT